MSFLEIIDPAVLIASVFWLFFMWVWWSFEVRTRRRYAYEEGKRKTPLETFWCQQIVHEAGLPHPYEESYWTWRAARDRQAACYRAIGRYYHPDCYIPDWLVVQVAVEFRADPELALQDAVDRGFIK